MAGSADSRKRKTAATKPTTKATRPKKRTRGSAKPAIKSKSKNPKQPKTSALPATPARSKQPQGRSPSAPPRGRAKPSTTSPSRAKQTGAFSSTPSVSAGLAKRLDPKIASTPSHAKRRKQPKPKLVEKRKRKPSARGLERARRDARNERARERREEQRLIAEALLAKREGELARRRQRYQERRWRRQAERDPNDEYAQAGKWLERIRDDIAQVFAVSLDMTEPGGGHADHDGPNETPGQPRPPRSKEAKQAARTPWLIVGRFDPEEPIGYVDLAHGLMMVYDDILLEAAINPQRLSQIRVVFSDPKSGRAEGDSVISKIGAWEFILSDLVHELIGSDPDAPDEESLAFRYKETAVPSFYVFFSTQTTSYKDVSPNAKTQSIKL